MTTNKTMWMVRAGEAGWRFEDFERSGIVSIGWPEMSDLSSLTTREAFLRRVEASYPAVKQTSYPGYAGQLYRFVREIKIGDRVLTYSPAERSYLVGTVGGAYEYRPEASEEQPNQRKVQWLGRVPRDSLSVATRNSLGSISTLFLLSADAANEIERLLSKAEPNRTATPTRKEAEEQVDDLYKDILNRPGF
jgi:restriction system protein